MKYEPDGKHRMKSSDERNRISFVSQDSISRLSGIEGMVRKYRGRQNL